jgi:hypothetical protein
VIIVSSAEVVWIVKLPVEYKELFEEMAKEVGDEERGAGARQLRKFLKKSLEGSA